jgi:type I restriction enzyme M protein
MARGKKLAAKGNGNGANLGFEPTLWAAAEYQHVVLGLIFLKYISIC